MKVPTQNEIAKFINVTQPTVSKYQSGELEISAKNANAIEREFGIPTTVWDSPLEAWADIKSFISNHNTKNTPLEDVS